MSKVIQVVVYKSVSDSKKLAAYAVLARPALEKAGAKFIARGVPIAVKEDGEAVRTIVIEWNGYGDAGYTFELFSTHTTPLFWGFLLGICIQRLLEKKEGIDEGWLRTVLMSFWFVTPCSIFFIFFVFY